MSSTVLQAEGRTPKQLDRCNRILKAARRAFAEEDFHKVLMEDVARSAGVGKGTIYRYFPDKESLYFSAIFDGIGGLKRRIRESLASQDTTEMRIRTVVDTLVGFFRQNRPFFRLMSIEDSKVAGGHNPNRRQWHRERAGLVAAIAEVLERGQRDGCLELADADIDAHLLLGMVRAMVRRKGTRLGRCQMVDEVCRVYLNGLAPR
jgi:AcrR family transcriptional regulator